MLNCFPKHCLAPCRLRQGRSLYIHGAHFVTPNTEAKIVRAGAIVKRSLLLADTFGQTIPCHYPGVPRQSRVVDLPPIRIEIVPDRYRTYAATSRQSVGPITFERLGWTMFEIFLHNERRALFNVCGDEVEIHHFQPGFWELKFGVDPAGDSAPVLPDLYPDDKDPAWRAFRASGLSQWPPQFPGNQASRPS